MSFDSDDFELRLIAALEAQQTHIAQELHDALGSQLSALVMALGALKNSPSMHNIQAESIDKLILQAQAAVQTTRKLARGLMPLDHEPDALWRMLERLCLDYDQIAGLSCQFIRHDTLLWVVPEVANPVYRIAQEALTNAFRSGQAQHVVVSLVLQKGWGCLTVQDDGIGMPSNVTNSGFRPGVGLRSMQARSRIMGASLAFEKNIQAGTTVRVTWPVAA